MNIHELKIAPQYFNDVLSGRKKAEVRFNDRNYQIGDTLNLNEFDNEINAITGRGCSVQITHVLHEVGLKDGYVNLSFELTKDRGLGVGGNNLYDPDNRFSEMFDLKWPVLSHYDKHIFAMTREKLNSKSEIATELGWRDWQIEQLQARIKELDSAKRTLQHLGNVYFGDEMWKSPIGKVPNFINEIKDSDIIELIDSFREEIGSIDKYHEEILIMFIKKIFRSKNEVINAINK